MRRIKLNAIVESIAPEYRRC